MIRSDAPSAGPDPVPAPDPDRTVRVRYAPRGAARELFACRDREVLIEGPAGTGKTRACLEKMHLALLKYPGARALAVRKTRAALVTAGVVTYRYHVLHPADGVQHYSGSSARPPGYYYPNGSVLRVGGLDRASRILSTEYDLIYVQEATELTEDEWETLTTRLRAGVLPYQQLLADCNPAGPGHWLHQRCLAGRTTRLRSRHADNPAITADYLATLAALSGSRRARLYLGQWAAAEGLVYDTWDPAVHLVPAFPVPRDWPRYWSIDFGYTNPAVWQSWAMDPDGRLYREREIYRTGMLVSDLASAVRAATRHLPPPRAVICDHDAEGRATFERVTGLSTVPAIKTVRAGIEAVTARLRLAGDGRPRLMLLRDALVARDPARAARYLPTCTEEEIEGYVWEPGGRERPRPGEDHGLDALRYLVAYHDLGRGDLYAA